MMDTAPDFNCVPTNEVRNFDTMACAHEGTSELDVEQSQWRDMEQMIALLKLQINTVSQTFRQLEKANQKTISQLKKRCKQE